MRSLRGAALLAAVAVGFSGVALARGAPPVPDLTNGGARDDKHDWNLGPTGARGWMWGHDLETTKARQILITKVETGSPAYGILTPGDVILGIGDRPFASDARKAFGAAITVAEEIGNKGRLKLLRWRKGKRKTVTIPLRVMGSYGETAPFKCRKSLAIANNACSYLLKKGVGGGVNGCVNALGLLATGRKDCVNAAKVFARGLGTDADSMQSWTLGYANLLLTELYLATGDRSLPPKIRKISEAIAEGQSGVGTWGHGFADPKTDVLAGYGAVNQCGIVCAMSLVLARKCKVDSPKIREAVERAEVFFANYVNKGSMPYGDHDSWDQTQDNNGANSSVSVFFDLAGNTVGAGYFSRLAVASYGIPETGHTGNYFSFLWGPLGTNRSGEDACAAFLKELRWFFDLERRWDGGFTYQGGAAADDSYNGWDTTGARLLMYSLPQKRLFITGRGMSKKNQLTGKALAETLKAGEGVHWHNRKTIYDDRDKDELLRLLGSWSPIVRNRAAWSLGKRRDVKTSELMQMFKRGDDDMKAGVLRALRFQGGRASSAVKPLIGLLGHYDARMRINAMHALRGIGQPARKAVPAMLQLARKEFHDDPRNFTRRNLCFVLFDGLLSRSVDGVDRKALFAAVRDMLRVDDGRARGAVGRLYDLMSFEELKPILPDILWAVENPSPSGVMFSAGIRDAGLKFLSSNRVKEAIPLLVKYARDQQQWGSQDRIVKIMAMLEGYGVHAKPTIPELKKIAEWCRTEKGFPEWARTKKREEIEKAIARIEAATEEPELISIGTLHR